MRTEEKKREKERQLAAATPTPVNETPAESGSFPPEATPDQNGTIEKSPSTQVAEAPQQDIETSDEVPREDAPAESKQPDAVNGNGDSETIQLAAEVRSALALPHHGYTANAHLARGCWPTLRSRSCRRGKYRVERPRSSS